MKRLWLCFFLTVVGVSFVLLSGSPVFAKAPGPPTEAIKAAFQQILAGADKNSDGVLSQAECMSISSNKSKIEKDCKYWDANNDGYITEEEYVNQVKGIMR